MDNRMYSEHAYQSDPEGDEPSADITLDEVGLCKGQKFALHYDFGDVEPDISVICDSNKLDDSGCKGAPDWVIEIVSPASKQMDYYAKLFKYRRMNNSI